jgi:amino acid transporter
LPRVLGRVHPRSRAPYVAILFYGALAVGFALMSTFVALAEQAALTSAALYIAGCGAAFRLARRGVAHAGPPLGFRWLGIAAATGIGSMVILLALASRRQILVLAALIALSVGLYALQAFARSGRPRATSGP